jgi:hypothetical protein
MAQTLINNVEEQNEVKEEKKYTEDQVLSMLFEKIEKPKKYYKIKAVNVYDNAFRVNIWCEFEENNLTKKKIAHSYFVKVVDGELAVKF